MELLRQLLYEERAKSMEKAGDIAPAEISKYLRLMGLTAEQIDRLKSTSFFVNYEILQELKARLFYQVETAEKVPYRAVKYLLEVIKTESELLKDFKIIGEDSMDAGAVQTADEIVNQILKQ